MFAIVRAQILLCSNWLVAFCSVLLFAGCGPSTADLELTKLKDELTSTQAQLATITKERNELSLKVEDLSNTPQVLLSNVATPAKNNDLRSAEAALNMIQQKFPQSPEAITAKKMVESLQQEAARKEAEEKRIKELGFKALKVNPSIETGVFKVKVGVPRIARQFVFDRYDSYYHYRDSDRDAMFVSIGLSITAGKSFDDPDLPGFALYRSDGDKLYLVDKFDLKFARWRDYGSYLGNYSDSGNDFAKTITIPFEIGAQVANDYLKNRPLYVVATTAGCLRRSYERFNNPPISYGGTCGDLIGELDLTRLSKPDSSLQIVRRID